MKRLALIFLGIILIVTLTGCGGSSKHEVGITMDESTINEKLQEYDSLMTMGMGNYVDAPGFSGTSFQNSSLTNNHPDLRSIWQNIKGNGGIGVQTLTPQSSWNGPDSGGWYWADFNGTTIYLRFLESSQAIQVKYEGIDFLGESLKFFISVSNPGDGLYDGYYTMEITINNPETGNITTKEKVAFKDMNCNNGTGTFDFWVGCSSSYGSIPFYHCAHIAVSFVDPPPVDHPGCNIHSSGWIKPYGQNEVIWDEWYPVYIP